MKTRKSILDPHADALAAWEAENLSLVQMQERLHARGCNVSIGRISGFLSARRRLSQVQAARAALFGMIRDAAETNRQLDAEFAKHPVPELGRLVQMTQSLAFDLKMQSVGPDGKVDRSKVELAATLLREITDILKTQAKEKEVALSLEKFEFDAAKACLAKLPELKTISDQPKLTPDEKAAAIRQILFPT